MLCLAIIHQLNKEKMKKIFIKIMWLCVRDIITASIPSAELLLITATQKIGKEFLFSFMNLTSCDGSKDGGERTSSRNRIRDHQLQFTE